MWHEIIVNQNNCYMKEKDTGERWRMEMRRCGVEREKKKK